MELLQYNYSCQIAPKDTPVCCIQTYTVIMMQLHTKNNLPDQFSNLLSLSQIFNFEHLYRASLPVSIRKEVSQSLDTSSDKETTNAAKGLQCIQMHSGQVCILE